MPAHTYPRNLKKIKEEKLEQFLMPAISQDINFIENVFGILKDKIKKSRRFCRKLKRKIKAEWKKLGNFYFRTLSDIMPRRLRQSLKQVG